MTAAASPSADTASGESRTRRPDLLSVQYLRGIAALMVVVFHALNHGFGRRETPGLTDSAVVLQSGVDIFFVISGLVMWYTTSGRNVSPRMFITNRLIRLVPAYWAITLFVAAVALTFPHLLNSTTFDGPHIAASLFFIPWPHPVFTDMLWPTVIPGWSLNYEMLFYVIFAAMLLRPAFYSVWFLAVVLIGIMLAAHLAGNSGIAGFYGSTIILEFLFGAIIGALVTHGVRIPLAVSLLLIAVGLVMLIVPWNQSLPRGIAWGIPAALIVAGAVNAELRRAVPAMPFFRLIGDASYSLYLIHGLVLSAAGRALSLTLPAASHDMKIVLLLLVGIPLSVIAAITFFTLYERPVARLLRGQAFRVALANT